MLNFNDIGKQILLLIKKSNKIHSATDLFCNNKPADYQRVLLSGVAY